MENLPASDYHVPVLYHETIEALSIQPNGVYVDCTFGGGGHSKGILEKLGTNGKLVAFDQDADAQQNIQNEPRLLFVPQNFRHLHRFLRLHGIAQVDGVLADLGVSSHQFNEGERGFSIRFEGPMDMRMDRRQGVTAADIIKTFSELQLHKMFEQYGEVTNAKTLAAHIVQQRPRLPFATIDQFKAMISSVVKGNPNKYLAQVFQALRMEVNDENNLYVSVTLPSLVIGTVGGGTRLPTQQECLRLLGCEGEGSARKLAEICGATVLAGELSIAASIACGSFSKAHKIFGRKMLPFASLHYRLKSFLHEQLIAAYQNNLLAAK